MLQKAKTNTLRAAMQIQNTAKFKCTNSESKWETKTLHFQTSQRRCSRPLGGAHEDQTTECLLSLLAVTLLWNCKRPNTFDQIPSTIFMSCHFFSHERQDRSTSIVLYGNAPFFSSICFRSLCVLKFASFLCSAVAFDVFALAFCRTFFFSFAARYIVILVLDSAARLS